MVALAAMVGFVIHFGEFPMATRAEFQAIGRTIRVKESKESVLQKLGKPDRICHFSIPLCEDRYDYGVDKASGIATLGWVEFRNDGVYDLAEFPREPRDQIVPEGQLRSLIGSLAASVPSWLDDDPLWTVRQANKLILLGEEKARYVLDQYEVIRHFTGSQWQYRDFLDMLFMPNSNEYPPRVMNSLEFSGYPQLNLWKGKMRDSLIRPAVDPFEGLRDVPKKDIEERLLKVLLLTRGAVQPVDLRVDKPKVSELENYHRAFLESHPAWNPDTQSYTRSDGRSLPDWRIPPEFQWDAPGLGRREQFAAWIQRRADTEVVSLHIKNGYAKHQQLVKRTLRMIDSKNKAELGRWDAEGDKFSGTGDFMGQGGGYDADWDNETGRFELKLPRHISIQFEWIGTRYKSPVFKID